MYMQLDHQAVAIPLIVAIAPASHRLILEHVTGSISYKALASLVVRNNKQSQLKYD